MTESKDSPSFNWNHLQLGLETAPYDVLLLLDCCHAASAVTKGAASKTMEILAGCARESVAAGPGGKLIRGSPFTHCLIKYLRSCAGVFPHGFSIGELQVKLTLDKVLNNQSPIHVSLSGQ